MVANSCVLFGPSNYVNSWLGINYIIIAIGFSIVSLVFIISWLLPTRSRTTMTNFLRFEVSQLIISVFIVLILLTFSEVICTTSAAMGSSLLGSVGINATGLSPFQYAQYYISGLALNKGFTLLDNIYTYSIQYAIDAQIWQGISGILSSLINIKGSTPAVGGIGISGEVSIIFGAGLVSDYQALSALYVSVFAPLTVLAIGVLIIQFISLPILQAVAFTVILPVAIMMRTLTFLGPKLREAADGVLALAVAAYLIYPITVVFGSYTMLWIFSSSNPLYSCTNCLNVLYATPPINASNITGAYANSSATLFTTPPSVFSFLSSIYPSLPTTLWPFNIPAEATQLAANIALFVFQSIFLFGVSFTITVGFAMGVAKGLGTGIGGSAQFWENL